MSKYRKNLNTRYDGVFIMEISRRGNTDLGKIRLLEEARRRSEVMGGGHAVRNCLGIRGAAWEYLKKGSPRGRQKGLDARPKEKRHDPKRLKILQIENGKVGKKRKNGVGEDYLFRKTPFEALSVLIGWETTSGKGDPA